MTAAAAVTPFASSAEQIGAELAWIELVLRLRALEVASRRGTDERFDEFAGLYVSEQEIARYADGERLAETRDDPRARPLRERIMCERLELDARAEASGGLRLRRLAQRFGLGVAEVRVLLCCLAPDWELRFQRYFAFLQNDIARRRPTIQLLAELWADGFDGPVVARAIFSPDAPLLRERLLTIGGVADLPFPSRQPVVSEAIVDYLAGGVRVDGLLTGVASIEQPRAVWPDGQWYERHRAIVAQLVRPLERDGRLPTAYVSGVSGAGKSLVVRAVASHAKVPLLRTDCRAWTAPGCFSGESVRALRRDALVHGCLVELAHCEALVDPSAADARAAIDAFLRDNAAAGIVLTGTTPFEELSAVLHAPLWSFAIERPGLAERADLWQRELTARGWQPDDSLTDTLSVAFRFTPKEMRRALEGYSASIPTNDSALDREMLVRLCRDTSRHTIHRFARKIVPRRAWGDLVLPPDTRTQLEEICAAARGRRRVHHDWGFEEKLALGSGLNVLFAGPSGVGKTMSAEIVAGELGLDLFAVDLSCVVSKYIGETEKNLSIVFDEAETTNAVLFFDECDALFGKRTEIRDAHDRYANIEVNYLLQRIDQYEGIVILATNLRSNVDAAFTRRIRYSVEFPFPEAEHRVEIWRKVFPSETPVATDVDVEFLARQFKLSGGAIKNIAVNAAFLAASNGGCVGMKHVIHATRRELQKMGKSCTKTEFGRYFSWVRDGTAE